MLPDNIKKTMQEKVYKAMANNFGGYNYCFVTQKLKGNYSYHNRPDQPCIGGELRKYRETHGKDCTRPDDGRPGDLEHPFPKTGAPAGVCYGFPITAEGKQLIDLMIREDSPWLKAFKSPEYVEYLPLDKRVLDTAYEPDKYVALGLTVKTGDIDPTLFVNFMKIAWEANIRYKVFKEAKDKGLSDRDAFIVTVFGSGYMGYYSNVEHLAPTDDYEWSSASSIKKFIKQEPNDLTGGLWSQRYDYNRPQMAEVFKDFDNPPEIPFITKVNNKISFEKVNKYVAAKAIIAEELGEM